MTAIYFESCKATQISSQTEKNTEKNTLKMLVLLKNPVIYFGRTLIMWSKVTLQSLTQVSVFTIHSQVLYYTRPTSLPNGSHTNAKLNNFHCRMWIRIEEQTHDFSSEEAHETVCKQLTLISAAPVPGRRSKTQVVHQSTPSTAVAVVGRGKGIHTRFIEGHEWWRRRTPAARPSGNWDRG